MKTRTVAMKPLGLYIHFPFCVRKCNYCDFLSFPSDEESRKVYLEQLLREIVFRGAVCRDHEIVSIFLGGGTPSLMSAMQLEKIMAAIRESFKLSPNAEITIECNPGTVDGEKLSAFKAAGINRISIGLQSMQDEELECLGRIHRRADFLECFKAAKAAGFTNINIDLMSALPGQTIESYLDTLNQVIALEPDHISAYSLIIEEGTPFGDRFDDGYEDAMGEWPDLPDEETDREMYHRTRKLLSDAGYERYEISNYAKRGSECRHNLAYWRRGDYLGVGLGAASLIGDHRFTNTDQMADYLKMDFSDPLLQVNYKEEEYLGQKEMMEETIFLGLRCTKGISISEFEMQFGVGLSSIYKKVIDDYVAKKLLIFDENADRMYLTEQGLDLSNMVLSDFLLD